MEAMKMEVLNSTDKNRLYEISIELTEIMGGYYKLIHYSNDELEKIDLKGKLSVAHAIQRVLELRTIDVREQDQRDLNQEMYINRQFRRIAAITLRKETYSRIFDLAHKDFKEIKPIKTELRADRLE